MRTAIVHNARSTRNRKGLDAVKAALAPIDNALSLDFDAASDLATIAAQIADADPDLLIINSGDGTVQGLLTALLEDQGFKTLPPIAIVPRGMANMTARDCGLRGRGVGRVAKLAAAVRDGSFARNTVNRHVLRISGAVGAPPQRGMFFGAAGIADAIRFAKSEVHKTGAKGELANLQTLTRLLVGVALGRKPAGMLEGSPIEIDSDGVVRVERSLLFLATTLDRLVLHSQPFWNEDGGPVRFTSIRHPPERLVRRVFTILYGGAKRVLPSQAYFSRGSKRVRVRFDGPFTIDGQDFRASASEPIEITAAARARFVRL